jgi:hypothetical protein
MQVPGVCAPPVALHGSPPVSCCSVRECDKGVQRGGAAADSRLLASSGRVGHHVSRAWAVSTLVMPVGRNAASIGHGPGSEHHTACCWRHWVGCYLESLNWH